MNKKVYKVFNEQVQAELYSAYMYLAMSLDMEAKNYKGMAKWLYLQYEEEREHALRFVNLCQDCSVCSLSFCRLICRRLITVPL